MLLKKLEKFTILLGSGSPRRKEILSKMGIKFQVRCSNCDETIPDEMKEEPSSVVEFLSKKKSESFKDLAADHILITADTLVYHENRSANLYSFCFVKLSLNW